MKILIISASDQGGGAFIATRRLHLALRKYGVDSHLLLAKNNISSEGSVGPTSNVARSLADLKHYFSMPLHLLHKTSNPSLHSFNIVPGSLHRTINKMKPDIVNLHWVNREMISISEISKINAPIVWTLHDMWPLLGAAHYEIFEEEDRESRGILNLDKWMYKRKRKHLEDKNIIFVGPSKWISEKVKTSAIFSACKSIAIKNALDLNLYKPIGRDLALSTLNLNTKKRYILFGAMSGISDARKGFSYLKDALHILGTNLSDNTELLIFGGKEERNTHLANLPFNVHYIGKFSDDLALMLIYNAADIYVTPSLIDNLPNTVAESLSCGTPVVAFRKSGGIGEMIEHKSNGYLAEYKSAGDLANGISWLLQYPQPSEIASACRRSAESQFAEDLIVKQYLDLLNESVLVEHDKG